jgi:aspartate/methionine/tyrosine aminotransferase
VHYTAALGLPQLREAISGFYRSATASHVSPAAHRGHGRRLGRTAAGAGDAGQSRRRAGCCPIQATPATAISCALLEGRPGPLAVNAEPKLQPTAEQVASPLDPRTKGLLVASPANPTGNADRFTRTRGNCPPGRLANGGSLMVDEIYHGLTYGGKRRCRAGHWTEDVFVINSFSKYFGMTGWRLGWLVAPKPCAGNREAGAEPLHRAVDRSPACRAGGLPARNHRHSRTRRREFQAAGTCCCRACEGLGFKIAAQPAGAPFISMPTAAQLGRQQPGLGRAPAHRRRRCGHAGPGLWQQRSLSKATCALPTRSSGRKSPRDWPGWKAASLRFTPAAAISRRTVCRGHQARSPKRKRVPSNAARVCIHRTPRSIPKD